MRKYLFTILVICSILTSLPASDASEVWSRLYGRVTSLEQKYTIMQKIIVMDDPSMEFMLINALDELVQGEFYNYTQGQSFELWQDLTIMIIRELGQIKAQDAAPNIRTVMRDYEGLLKSEAMIALGSMGAVEYTEDIATVLRNLNYNTDTDRDRAEIEAYGAIVGLRRMGQIEGFESVFYSHLGWYSRKIKDLASQTLIEMVNDPSDEILSIMDSASFGEKNIALDVEIRSNAPEENKNSVAARALEMGVNNQGKDVEEETQLRLLRLKSMEVMIENQASMDDILSYIEIIYRNTDVLEEKLTSLLVLSANGSDDAVSLLVEFLDIFNERKLGGINPNNEEQQIILQILFSLGDSGNAALAMPALSQIEIYDYSNSINRTAKLAMENYQ